MQLDILSESLALVLRHELNYSEATIRRYMVNASSLGRYLAQNFFQGEIPDADEIQPVHIRRFLAHLAKEKGLKPSTVITAATDLSAFFSHATKAGLVEESPVHRIRLPKVMPGPPRYLSVQEIKALFSAVDMARYAGYRDLVILKAIYYAALRASEVARLRVNDLSDDLKLLYVRKGKGAKDRVIPIHPHLQDILKNYLALKQDAASYLFAGPRGNRFTNCYISYLAKKYARKANLPQGASTHWLRHSFATHLAQMGVKVHNIAALLGHNSVDTTLVYAHKNFGELAELMTHL